MISYAIVRPASGGFGMYETGEWTVFGTETGEFNEDAPEVQQAEASDYLGYLAERGFQVIKDAEMDGRVYNQGGDVYRITDIETGDERFQAVKEG